MINFHIGYEAHNEYDHDVHEAFFEFLVRPCENDKQQVTWEKSTNSNDSAPFRSRNVFGYESICLRLADPFNEFKFRYDCKVQKDSRGYIPIRNEQINLADEQQILTSETFQVDHYLFIKQTPLTTYEQQWIPDHMLYQPGMFLLDYVKQLSQQIHQYIKYTPNVTTVRTTAKEIWSKPCGVCQDYSHLMLGILRSQHIPSRYVSGYLNQGKKFVGSAQMHAWVEVSIPNYGWIGLDPTNNLWADYHYIKVADGQDYQDCSPLKGHIKPSGINCTDHSVQVVEQ